MARAKLELQEINEEGIQIGPSAEGENDKYIQSHTEEILGIHSQA